MMMKNRKVINGAGFDVHIVVSCFNGGCAIFNKIKPRKNRDEDGETGFLKDFYRRKIKGISGKIIKMNFRTSAINEER